MSKIASLLLLALLGLGSGGAARAGQEAPRGTRVTVTLKDGGRLVGQVVSEDEENLTLALAGGGELRLPRSSVASIEPLPRPGVFTHADPNTTRLLFAPTGRPLGKGEGYFSDHYVLFPGFAYGLSDHLSLGAGASTVPGLSLTEQLYYVSPRVAWQPSATTALSAGVLFAGAGDENDAAALFYGVLTLGEPARSFSVGIGLGGTREQEWPSNRTKWEWRDAPILMLGGNLQLSNRVALVSENWLFLGKDFDIGEQPFSLALRLFGDRLSADVGFVLVAEIIEEGLPIPWLSISYHFGKSRNGGQARAGSSPRPAADLARGPMPGR